MVSACVALTLLAQMILKACARPRTRALNRFYNALPRRGQSHEIIKHHHNIAIERVLNLKHFLGGKEVLAPIDMGFELHAIFIQSHIAPEAKGLESPTIAQIIASKVGKVVNPPKGF